MKHFIVVMRDQDIWLVGPFPTQAAAAEHGRTSNVDDDPRWQTIELDDAISGTPLRIETPSA